MLDINKYCDKKYEVMYLINTNGNIYIGKYKDSVDNVNVSIVHDPEDNLYTVQSSASDSKNKFYTHRTNKINGSIYGLYKKNQCIKLLSDGNNKDLHFTTNSYDILLPGDKEKKISIEFDAIYRVIYDEEYHICMSFLSNEDQCLEGDKLVETFWFNTNGYYYENQNNNEYSSLVGNTEVAFNIPTHDNIIDIDILTKIPDIISYSNNKEYRLFYDKYGVVKNIIDKSDNELDMVKYQLEYDDNTETIASLHPLLYDSFDYSYIDKPMKYWAIDQVMLDKKDGSYSIKRLVYEIKGNSELNELLDFIKTPESLI